MTLSSALLWGRSLSLEESGDVINVVPLASLDPAGGFLVADEREAQVRRYSPDGKLLWHAGRRGSGPGEFTAPTAALRLHTGEIVVLDRTGRLTTFDSLGATVVRTVQTPLGHISDAEVMRDTLLLIAGVHDGKMSGGRLHLVDPVTGAVKGSFFAPFVNAPNKIAATVAGWTEFSTRGDTVAAIFATSDTVYLFTTAGQPLNQLPIRSSQFRRVPRDGPPVGTSSPMERARWLGSFDLVADVHWLTGGDLLVPYQNLRPNTSGERQWHLLKLSATGETELEVRGVPRLLEVDRQQDALYFMDPLSEMPNQWVQARLRN